MKPDAWQKSDFAKGATHRCNTHSRSSFEKNVQELSAKKFPKLNNNSLVQKLIQFD